MKSLLASTAIIALLSGCTQLNQQAVDPLIQEITNINNAGLADLQSVEAVASVPNANLPSGIEDEDGLNCAKAGVTVLTQTQSVLTAANNPNAGVLTVAEIASLFQPGSVQYNQASNTLATGCVAKANDVLGAAGVVAAGGVVAAMVANTEILPLASVSSRL